jgi:hypothetical protein
VQVFTISIKIKKMGLNTVIFESLLCIYTVFKVNNQAFARRLPP